LIVSSFDILAKFDGFNIHERFTFSEVELIIIDNYWGNLTNYFDK